LNTRAVFLSAVLISGVVPEIARAAIIGPLVEGAMTIKGVATPGNAVQFFDMNGKVLGAGAAMADGSFVVMLPAPLVAGQQVQARQAPPPPAGVVWEDLGSAVPVVGIADWGRVRATFTAGTVLSADNNFQGRSSTQSTLFLDFTAEKNWRSGGLNAQDNWQRRLLFSTFFETRLTSVPQAQMTSTATPPAGGGTGNTPDTLTTFISSQKSALMVGGAYFPYLTNKWIWHNTPYALFAAPLAKVGFITPVGSTTTQTTAGTAQPVNPQQFYNFYGWGGRIGHYKLSYDSANEAPELMSYIDVTVGRFSNLETLAPLPNGSGTYPIRQYRVAIEGALKVPATPLLLGFSANLGQNLLSQPHTLAAKDDLRFFFGTTFDIGRLFGKLAQF
jgi:hypothetical protein